MDQLRVQKTVSVHAVHHTSSYQGGTEGPGRIYIYVEREREKKRKRERER